MSFHWVNIGDSYQEVLDNGFLWAPTLKITETGKKTRNAGWDSVENVRKNDIIFCNRDGAIIYVAIAKKDTFKAPKPVTRTFNRWHNEGFQVDVKVIELDHPIPVNDFKYELNNILAKELKPKVFDKNLNNCQIYMAPLNLLGGAFLLDLIGDESLTVHEAIDDSGQEALSGSDKTILSKARVGHGKYREELLSLWDSTCPITAINEPSLLIASHIVPWQLSDSFDKVNKYNGLLLSPHIDKLFDRGFISFDDSGQILFHTKMSSSTAKNLGISTATRIDNLKAENLPFLKKHRELFAFE